VKSVDFRIREAKRIGKASSGLLDEVLLILDACLYLARTHGYGPSMGLTDTARREKGSRLDRLVLRTDYIIGDPDDLVELDWSQDWARRAAELAGGDHPPR